ncbi:hypothetical protein CBL_08356 [Carabus blaptoides fortunei]
MARLFLQVILLVAFVAMLDSASTSLPLPLLEDLVPRTMMPRMARAASPNPLRTVREARPIYWRVTEYPIPA